MKRIGIFAGTFDPVHHGHIAFCLAAATQCGLDKVYFLPERVPRGKQVVSDFVHRQALLNLATESHENLGILSLDDDQFTVAKTLPRLQEKFPDAALTLLIGSDVACGSLTSWNDLDTLLAQMELAIGVRSDSSTDTVQLAMEKLRQTHPNMRYTIIASPYAGVSSSQLRSSPTGTTPQATAYMELHHLYGFDG